MQNNAETIKRWSVILLGLVVVIGLNHLMLYYNYDLWTNPKVGFWSAFYKHFEMSGFDDYPYVVVSKWRPMFILERHPLLALMLWPFTQLNGWMMATWHMNFAMFIVGGIWIVLGFASWMLMYRLMHRIMELSWSQSLLLTMLFYSFSHVMMVLFVCDHMGITLLLMLLTITLAGKAIKQDKPMPLWQSLPLVFLATGVTTTNVVKVFLADFFTRSFSLRKLFAHFLCYLVPLAVIGVIYFWQKDSTQKKEDAFVVEMMKKRAAKDSVSAEKYRRYMAKQAEKRKHQKFDNPLFNYTEHVIDRVPSLVENVFGEGFILHPADCKGDDDVTKRSTYYVLCDPNENHRPVLVRYNHWFYYAIEAILVAMFIVGIWCGRRNKVLWIALSMFLFDMLLHVGLEFASSDLYIMTAHWAFVLPIAYACMLKSCSNHMHRAMLMALLALLAAWLWYHNLTLIVQHILSNPYK